MKKLLCTSVAGLLIGSALPAFAASTTDLTVKGMIVPSACTPSLTPGGTINIGRFSVKDLNQDAQTRLTPVTLQLSINCEAPTLFAMTATDNRVDSKTNVIELGLGKTAAGEPIGGYTVYLDKVIADQAIVQPIGSMNNGNTWFRMFEDEGWQTDMLVSIKQPGVVPVAPIPAKDTQMEFLVNPFIHPAKNLTISQDTGIDGSATISVVYL
ncbi:DUF1120 domain-containing protein [Pseudomonas sp. TWR1-1-4]|uniref:DUF1120 domain-containing protein n=1 Tax=Pseudomonas sp. TWR1-1-4 TaxID=2804604 RepID=UPI003CE6CA22